MVRSRRRGIAVLLIGLMVGALAPLPVSAIPVEDRNLMTDKFIEGAARAAAWSQGLQKRMEELRHKAYELVERTKELTERREHEEILKYGELAGLGEELPTWYDIKNSCAGDVQRYIDCETLERVETRMIGLIERLEDVIPPEVFGFAAEVEDRIAQVQAELDPATMAQHNAMQALFRWDLSTRYGAIEQASRDRGLAAMVLDSLALAAEEIIEEAIEAEQLEEEVSSGRAMQLVAYLKIAEATQNLNLARNETMTMRTRAMEAMDDAAKWGFQQRHYRERRAGF